MTRPVKSYCCTRGSSFSWKDSVPSVQGRGNTCAKKKYEASATYWAHENFSLHFSYLAIFRAVHTEMV